MEEGEFFAIETFGSTGKGIVHEVAAGPAQRGREGGWERRREERERERERERQTETERERKRERERDRQTETERERERLSNEPAAEHVLVRRTSSARTT